MDGDEAIDGSELRRRFAGAATLSAEGGMTPTTGAFSDYQSSPTTVRLFDPNRFLAVIAVLFWPLRFLPIVLIPAVFLAGLTDVQALERHYGRPASAAWRIFFLCTSAS